MSEYSSLISSVAAKFGLYDKLIEAVVWQESSYNPWAMRYESGFFKRYLKDKPLSDFTPKVWECSEDTERRLRAFSFGLMQIIGQTARENGFTEINLTRLLDPVVNLEMGCKLLKKWITDKGSTADGLLRYNGGGNKHYADQVLAKAEMLQ